jgi:hypothetical protein
MTRVCHFNGEVIVCELRGQKGVETNAEIINLVRRIWVVEIKYLYVTFSSSNSQYRVLHVEGVASFRQLHGSDRVL